MSTARLDDEIRKLRVAMARTEADLDEMQQRWRDAGGLCCPGCMFGARWRAVSDKAERQAGWLDQLMAKRAG